MEPKIEDNNTRIEILDNQEHSTFSNTSLNNDFNNNNINENNSSNSFSHSIENIDGNMKNEDLNEAKIPFTDNNENSIKHKNIFNDDEVKEINSIKKIIENIKSTDIDKKLQNNQSENDNSDYKEDDFTTIINSKIEKLPIIIEINSFSLNKKIEIFDDNELKNTKCIWDINDNYYSFIIRTNKIKKEVRISLSKIILFFLILKESRYKFIPIIKKVINLNIDISLYMKSPNSSNDYYLLLNNKELINKIALISNKTIDYQQLTSFLVKSFKYFNFRNDILFSKELETFLEIDIKNLIEDKLIRFIKLPITIDKRQTNITEINKNFNQDNNNCFSVKIKDNYVIKNILLYYDINVVVYHLEAVNSNLSSIFTGIFGTKTSQSIIIAYKKYKTDRNKLVFQEIFVKEYLCKISIGSNDNNNIFVISEHDELNSFKIIIHDEEIDNHNTGFSYNENAKEFFVKSKINIIFLCKFEEVNISKENLFKGEVFISHYENYVIAIDQYGMIKCYCLDEVNNQIHLIKYLNLCEHFEGKGLIKSIIIKDNLIFIPTISKLILVIKILKYKNASTDTSPWINLNLFSRLELETTIKDVNINKVNELFSPSDNQSKDIKESSNNLILCECNKFTICNVTSSSIVPAKVISFNKKVLLDSNFNGSYKEYNEDNYMSNSISKYFIDIDYFNCILCSFYSEKKNILFFGLNNGVLLGLDLKILEITIAEKISKNPLTKLICCDDDKLVIIDYDEMIYYILIN